MAVIAHIRASCYRELHVPGPVARCLHRDLWQQLWWELVVAAMLNLQEQLYWGHGLCIGACMCLGQHLVFMVVPWSCVCARNNRHGCVMLFCRLPGSVRVAASALPPAPVLAAHLSSQYQQRQQQKWRQEQPAAAAAAGAAAGGQ
jgi:hypothetical protein